MFNKVIKACGRIDMFEFFSLHLSLSLLSPKKHVSSIEGNLSFLLL